MPRVLLSGLSGLRRLEALIAPPDVAIDLGTANTRLYATGRGIIADEPSIVRMDDRLLPADEAIGEVESPGQETTISPMRAGVVTDIEAATSLLKPLLRRTRRFGLIRPRVLACVPTDACDEERAALIEATRRAGASAVVLAPEPLAAAIGAGLDVGSLYAHLLVDIGDGVTDIAVIRSGHLEMTAAARTACSDLHTAVQRMVATRHGVWLAPHEAERLTRRLGVVRGDPPATTLIAIGTSCETQRQAVVCVTSQEVCTAIAPIIETIVGAVCAAVRDLPHAMACEVIESGICLTGGGACLHGMAELIAAETGIDVRLAAAPLYAVINGAREMLVVGAATDLWMSE